MTKTFENGPHVAVTPTMPAPIAAAASNAASSTATNATVNTSQEKTVGSKVYNAIVSATPTASTAATTPENTTNSLSEEDSVTNLDELKLRSLLEEAIAYKSPKDREGKSELFRTLLIDAEDDLRKEHAHNASGPARHFSSTAKKRHRQRQRQPSSVSVNLTHGGSLNDLAKQELYEAYDTSSPTCGIGAHGRGGGSSPLRGAGIHHHHMHGGGCAGSSGSNKTVATRQREGGSLPCNVNAGAPHVDAAYFMEERARQLEQRSKQRDKDAITAASAATTTAASATTSTAQRLSDQQESAGSFISKTSIAIAGGGSGGNSVDEAMSFAQLSGVASLATHNADGTPRMSLAKQVPMQQYGLIAKKDENDNALTPTSSLSTGVTSSSGSTNAASGGTKRKSKQRKPTEKSTTAENIEGHRADIIENIDKLVSYIEGTEEKAKKKQLHKQHSHTLSKEDAKSKRARKKSASMLHKSNSMEEMSTTKLEDFHFEPLDAKEKAPLRTTKSNAERPSRHHKAWVLSSEQLPVSTSAENLEIADFIYVTKKKKSKKRRNSLGSRGAQQTSESRPAEFHSLRACGRNSPRRKSASSAPHSDRDSSDNESVHSLPLDGDSKSQQISYADIAKSSERPKFRPLSERRKNDKEDKKPELENVETVPAVVSVQEPPKEQPPKETDTDLSSLQNWPEIRNNKVNQAKNVITPEVNNVQTLQDWPSIISNGGKTSNNVKPMAESQHAKNDNKSKKTKAASPPTNHAANEHLQQVLQVSLGNANASYIYRHNHNHQEVHHEEETVINNPQQVIQQVSEQQHLYQMPPNIRDVQSIEEMQMRSLQAAQMSPALVVDEEEEYAANAVAHLPPANAVAATPTPTPTPPAATVLLQEKHRPAVVILSSGGGDRHSTADITFGFGINEQLLSGDACADFVSRFLQPDVVNSPQVTTHLDQLVNYVGSEWEDIIMQTHTGKVKYYTDELS